MSKGQYIIDDTRSNGRGDTSFRSCIITIVIFLLFCATVVIVLFVMKFSSTSSTDGEDAKGSSSALEGKSHGSTTSPDDSTPAGADDEAPPEAGVIPAAELSTPPATPTTTVATAEHDAAPDPRRLGSEDAGDVPTNASLSPSPTPLVSDPTSAGADEDAPPEAGEIPVPELSTPPATTHAATTPAATPTTTVATAGHDAGVAHDSASEVRSGSEDAGDVPIDASLPPPPLPSPSPTPLVPAQCKSVDCLELASHILSTMGHGTKPCKNFYDYACGGLRRNRYLLEPDYAAEAFLRIIGQVHEINKHSPKSYMMFKNLILSCNAYDTNAQEELWRKEVLAEMQNLGFSVDAEPSVHNFTNLFLELLRHDRPFIFDVTLDVNDTDPTRFALKMLPSQLGVNYLYPINNEVMECQAEAVKLYNNLDVIYTETMKCVNEGAGRNRTLQAAKEALKMLNILHAPTSADKLNELLRHYEEFLQIDTEAMGDKAARFLELQKRNGTTKTKTIHELNVMFENIEVDWKILIEGLIKRPITESERVEVYAETYFSDINKNFTTEHHARLRNALLVAFAAARHRDLLVAQQRWRRAPEPLLHCTRVAALLMPDVASSLYLRAFPSTLRDQLDRAVEDLLFDLSGAVIEEIGRAKWMSDNTHASLEFKIRHVYLSNTTDMGFLDDTAPLDAELQHYTINEDNFVANALSLMARNRKRLYERINMQPKDCIWSHFIYPYASNGKTIYSLNTIAIPLGATEKPFFHPEYPAHIRMAGLGFVVAHEIAHLFDLVGMQFESNMTSTEMKDYSKRTPALTEFTDAVLVDYLNETGVAKHKHLQFKFTSDQSELKKLELMSDIMSIKLAFKGLNEVNMMKDPKTLPFVPLTIKEGFFVHLIQKYCTKMNFFSQIVNFYESPDFPEEPRVHKMLQNNDFYETFKCSGDMTDYKFPYGMFVDDDIHDV